MGELALKDALVKEALKCNRTLLVRNIIPSAEFYGKLAEMGVLSDSMLREIKILKGRDEQNEKLMDVLPVMGRSGYTKFCDVLHDTGHQFLADLLRDEVIGRESPIEIHEIFKKLPTYDVRLKDQEKQELVNYLNEKIKEHALKLSWKSGVKDKEKALDAKQKQLEENWDFKEQLITKDKTILSLKEQLEAVTRQIKGKDESIRNLTEIIEQLKEKHRVDMETQMNYNVANDNSLRRLNERVLDAEKSLNEINLKIKSRLIVLGDWDRSVEDSTDHVKMSLGEKVKHNLEQLINKLGELDTLRERLVRMSDDQFFILTHIGVDVEKDKNVDVITAFREYVVSNDETKTALSKEIESLTQMLDSTRRENEVLKATVSNLEAEVAKLKQKKKELSRSTSADITSAVTSSSGRGQSWQQLETINLEQQTPRLLERQNSIVTSADKERKAPDTANAIPVNDLILPVLSNRPQHKHLLVQPKPTAPSNPNSDFPHRQGGLTVKSMNAVDKRMIGSMHEFGVHSPSPTNGFMINGPSPRSTPRFGSQHRLIPNSLKAQTGLTRQPTFHGLARRTNTFLK